MPPQPDQSPSFMQQYATAKWLMQFPARSVTVFFRWDIGYRLLDPLVLLAVFGFVAALAVLAAPGNDAARPLDLFVFAVIGFFCGMVQRIHRWWSLSRSVRQHSFFIGSSPFDRSRLPTFLRRRRRAARFLDPLFCAGVGFILLPHSKALALWLIFSGLCLRGYEFMVHERQRDNELDINDSLIEADRNSRTVEQSEQVEHPELPDDGVPTGLGHDIRDHFKRRKSK